MYSTEKPRRVVLKISGECFCPPKERGIAMSSVMHLAEQVAKVARNGVQIAIVMGGGNILRGGQFKAANASIQESTAHYMGMLATVINGMALQDAIELVGQQTRLMTAFAMESVAEPYIRRRAVRHLEKGRIILLAGGTGSPFVTTDTAAAQRALELNADVLLKATKVDGVYSDDPEKNPHAVLYPELTYDQVQQRRLRIMDQESIAKCGEHQMPVMIFNFRTPGNLERALQGERVGTLISEK
ncbi:MAG: UMP kinase [Planctomycetaceae bacterium]|jgi:uridylate kinase|nr:UMP kinase [Planctomycetaceae bacterium]